MLIDFHEARNELDRLIQRGADLTMMVDPNDYESIGQVRLRQGKRARCTICGGTRFVRFPFPVNHKWFGKAISCPNCKPDQHHE